MLIAKRIDVTSEKIKPWIKYFWHLYSTEPMDVNHKLIPTSNVDIILNYSDDIYYRFNQAERKVERFHFRGISMKPCYITQKGLINVVGISFFPYGMFPFIRRDLDQMVEPIYNLADVMKNVADRINNIELGSISIEDYITKLQLFLEDALNVGNMNISMIHKIRDYIKAGYDISIIEFCRINDISVKTFERACKKYVGYTPKKILRLERFLDINRRMLAQNKVMFDLMENDYFFDQSHFIKDFHALSGNTPNCYIHNQDTVKNLTSLE